MKRRRAEHAERRRPLVELNLMADTKPPRLGVSRRGCTSFLTPVLLGLAALLVLNPGLR